MTSWCQGDDYILTNNSIQVHYYKKVQHQNGNVKIARKITVDCFLICNELCLKITSRVTDKTMFEKFTNFYKPLSMKRFKKDKLSKSRSSWLLINNPEWFYLLIPRETV